MHITSSHYILLLKSYKDEKFEALGVIMTSGILALGPLSDLGFIISLISDFLFRIISSCRFSQIIERLIL